MDVVIKLVGCMVLALSCIAIPILAVLSIVYQWFTFFSFCLILGSFIIVVAIFSALMDAVE